MHTVLPDAASDRVIVAMSTGGVYVSEDGAEKWTPANRGIGAPFLPEPPPEFGQCVHKVAVDAAGPDRLYAQNHPGVFRSDDGGASWMSISADLPYDFGFPVLASPTTPGLAWVIPLEADARRIPPGGRLRPYRTQGCGRELGRGRRRAAGRLLGQRAPRRRLRRRGRPDRRLPRHPGRLRLRECRRGRVVRAGRRASAGRARGPGGRAVNREKR